jgi:ApbE superfamily uncharacterized protein (UPF0280 family)
MNPINPIAGFTAPCALGLGPQFTAYPHPVQVLRPDLILVDYGPMTLTISAWAEGESRPVMAARAAATGLELLEALGESQALLKTPVRKLIQIHSCPELIQDAARACREVSPELTGLAAVAGLVADRVLIKAASLGADRVIVNNGGDIALKASNGQPVRVGMKTYPEGEVTHFLEITSNDSIGGVATSGWTGRSFSPGVADVVTVWAGDCSTADAAATWIAARTTLPTPKIHRVPAKAIDPETDIPLLQVTRGVDPLSREEKREALQAGLSVAAGLLGRGVIQGAWLSVQGEVEWIGLTPGLQPALYG